MDAPAGYDREQARSYHFFGFFASLRALRAFARTPNNGIRGRQTLALPPSPLGGLAAQADAEFAQLRLVDGRRCRGQRATGRLRLREGHDVTDRLGPRHQHDQAIEAEGDTAMGRGTVFKRIQQEAELFACAVEINAQYLEGGFLQPTIVDTD